MIIPSITIIYQSANASQLGLNQKIKYITGISVVWKITGYLMMAILTLSSFFIDDHTDYCHHLLINKVLARELSNYPSTLIVGCPISTAKWTMLNQETCSISKYLKWKRNKRLGKNLGLQCKWSKCYQTFVLRKS